LLDYTLNNANVRVALRKAKKKRIINKMWRDFIDRVEEMQGANLAWWKIEGFSNALSVAFPVANSQIAVI